MPDRDWRDRLPPLTDVLIGQAAIAIIIIGAALIAAALAG